MGSSPPTSGSSNSSSSRRSARPTSRRRMPSSAGPSGVSSAARRPATASAGSPIAASRLAWAAARTAASSVSRSAAAKSTASRTRCTSVPTSRPTGIVGEEGGDSERGILRCGRRHRRRGQRLVHDHRVLGLARHPRLVRPGRDVAVGGPPPPPVEAAIEDRGPELSAGRAAEAPSSRAVQAEIAPRRHTRARLARHFLEARHRFGVAWRASTRPPPRCPPRRGRTGAGSSGAFRLSHEPAHHTTAWCRARVSATYASRRSSPRSSTRCCPRWRE